ncbi:substrate-binding domain-containing protein [Mycobacterium genavense]|uniref:substrate-binding domain-containing protein n=1 Tax=Mycobacterium genavense TaxID=36812 RepID=UPI00046FC473|nr:substrate-binding domain-containing protein [Mycobacterium genavense]
MGRHSMPGKSADDPSDDPTIKFTARDLVSRYQEERDKPDPRDLDEDDDYDDYPDPDEEDSDEDAEEDFGDDGYAAQGLDDEYPEFPSRPESSAPPEATPGDVESGHRVLGDWRGGHRSAGGRRGVSIGVIVALVAVIVVVGTVILWSFFGDALSHRSHTAAARCVGGKETVAVVVDPSIVDQVRPFAESYNSTAGPVGDHCMVVDVKPAGSDAVVAGFIGKWPAELGSQPALWIPGSSVSAARLSAAAGQKTISDSRSLVTSPVLLAVRPELAQALSNQNWGALPGLQTNPNSLAALKLPAWGSLRLALPTNGNSDASYLAGEAVAAASVPPGAPPTQGAGALRSLTGGQPKLADNSLTEAMNVLLKPGDPATAPVHAVITTEQQVFQCGESLPDAKTTLATWLPPGPAPVADYPTVLLNGSWLSKEQTSAASEFAHFMRKPEQLAKLAKAGFRVNGVKPPSSPVTSFAALPSTLSVGDDAMRATLADAMAAPSSGLAATIMLDQSMPGDEGGKTRLANVIAALQDRIKALPPTAIVGLWTFDGHEGRSEVATGPLSDPVNGQPRPAALAAALDKQYSSAGGAVSFTTLRMIYQDMQTNYRVGQSNSILVITAGPHTDQSLDGPGLQNFIRTSADPAKPIAVNVIDFGADPDRATWEAVAQLSGGGYQNLATSASPDLATAISTFLS